jgi:hypothetical protein
MIRFASHIGSGGVTVKFAEKPPAEILAILKGAGFRWQPFDQTWHRQRVAGAADFLLALERRCNPDRPDGACWKCQAPDGYFRPCGAATPVYCAACWEAIQADERRRADSTPRVWCGRPMGIVIPASEQEGNEQ